jgi:hypothetical protein
VSEQIERDISSSPNEIQSIDRWTLVGVKRAPHAAER